MENKKGEISFKLTIAVVFGIALLIIAAVIGFLLVQNVSSIYEEVETSATLSETYAPLTSLTNYITPTGEGITSSEVKAYNQTWLDFDGVDDYVNVDNSSLFSSNNTNEITITMWINRGILADGCGSAKAISIIKKMKENAKSMNNTNEVEILSEYLPEVLSTEETIKIVEDMCVENSYTQKDMGTFMKEIKSIYGSTIDMKLVSITFKNTLNG